MSYLVALVVGMFVLAKLRSLRGDDSSGGSWLTGRSDTWTSAARQLGLSLVPGGEASLTSYPYRSAMTLTGVIDGCEVRVERLEDERQAESASSRVTVRASRQPAAGGGDAQAILLSLIRRGVQAQEGAVFYQEPFEMDDLAVVAVVRNMVALSTERARDVLERLIVEHRAEDTAETLRFLLAFHPYAACRRAIAAVAASGHQEALCVALAAAVKARDGEVVERVAGMSEVAAAPLGKAIAGALGAMPGANAELILLRLLKHEAGEVRHAAADALGIAGTVSAVEPLMQARGRHAEEAVKRIQSRLHAEAGRLSQVTNATEGQISEAPPGIEGAISAVRTRG